MLLIYILMPLWQIWYPTPPTNYFIRLMERYMMFLAIGIIGLMSLLFLCTAIALIPSPNLKIYVWLFLLALFVQMQFEPLGDHIQPQFIAILLLCFQKESSHYKSEDSYFNDTPMFFFGVLGNSQYINSQCNKEQASFQPR